VMSKRAAIASHHALRRLACLQPSTPTARRFAYERRFACVRRGGVGRNRLTAGARDPTERPAKARRTSSRATTWSSVPTERASAVLTRHAFPCQPMTLWRACAGTLRLRVARAFRGKVRAAGIPAGGPNGDRKSPVSRKNVGGSLETNKYRSQSGLSKRLMGLGTQDLLHGNQKLRFPRVQERTWQKSPGFQGALERAIARGLPGIQGCSRHWANRSARLKKARAGQAGEGVCGTHERTPAWRNTPAGHTPLRAERTKAQKRTGEQGTQSIG